MPENIRALIVIVALAVPAFYIGRQIASSTSTDREFGVWRNIWFAVILGAFLSGNFFVYALIVVIACVYARSVGAASVCLYFILLFAVPSCNISIGGLGIINQLFDLSNPRLLSIVLLLPILLTNQGFNRRQIVCAMPDWLVIGYVLLQTALAYRASNATVTNEMRIGVLLTLDVLIPYFAFSRTVTTLADARKVFGAFIIAVLPLSLIAVFEGVKHWHLYFWLNNNWGIEMISYLERAGMLRASASAVDSITLGFVIMVAIGCMLGIWQTMRSSQIKGIISVIFAAGLIATLARGPWVGTAALLLVYFAIGPNPIANLGKVALIGALGLALLLVTPIGTRLIDLLPFVGSDEGSVVYRQMLFNSSLVVIERNPLFGSPDYRMEPELVALTTGQHIIDFVNTYIEIALKSGLVVLSLFFGFFAAILLRLRRVLKFHRVRDGNFNTCIRGSIAILVAMLVTIATVSSIDFIPYVYWSFAGLSVALVRIAYREQAVARAAQPTYDIISRRTT